MHLGTIPFCEGHGHLIKSDVDKEYIANELASFGITLTTRSYDRYGYGNTLKNIKTKPHRLSLKTRGNSFFLVLLRIDNVEHVVFVDRKIQRGFFYPRMILTKLFFDSSLFFGTVLEGEMTQHRLRGEWTFFVNDILVYRGHVVKAHVDLRMSMIENIVENEMLRDALSVCRIERKTYYDVADQEVLLQEVMPKFPYDVKGLLFKSTTERCKDVLLEFREDPQVRGERNFKIYQRSQSNPQPLEFQPLELEPSPQVSKKLNVNSPPFKPRQPLFQSQYPTQFQKTSFSRPKFSLKEVSEHKIVDIAPPPPPPPKIQPEISMKLKEQKEFEMKRTNMPDVYELIANREKEIAYIPNIATSRFLRDFFSKIHTNSRIKVSCQFNRDFQKWEPIVESCQIVK